MKRSFLFAAAVTAASLGWTASPALAQSGGTSGTPAEQPPASFQGREYVDSTGCVFIRAGVDGNTTWVPRVSRDRQPLCGQTPSLGGTAVAASPAPAAPAPAPAPAPVRTTTATTAPAVVPVPRVAAPAEPVSPKSGLFGGTPSPAPQPTRVAGPKPKPKKPKQVAHVQMPAYQPSYAPTYARPMAQAGAKQIIRPGEDQIIYPGQLVGNDATHVAGGARIVPRHVYETLHQKQVYPPAGYESVWDDDRLNSQRAFGTLKGRNQMLLVWTNTVPRRLVNKYTGKDVTARYPKLIYPFTNMREQRAYLSTKGTVKPKVATTQPVRKPVVQARAATPKPNVQAVQGRFVQVGMFSNEANAKATAQRFMQMGLPVKYGIYKRASGNLRSVMIGPLAPAQLGQALNQAKRAGFRDAYIR